MKDEVPAECQRTQAQVVCRCCCWVKLVGEKDEKTPPAENLYACAAPRLAPPYSGCSTFCSTWSATPPQPASRGEVTG